MIVYSKQKVLSLLPDIVPIDGENEEFFYVLRSVYDEAVILDNTYEVEALKSKVNTENNTKAYEYLLECLPHPINILSPFICLVKDELELDIRTLCGVLSVILSTMSAVKFVSEDIRLRRSIEYSGKIVNEFELSWKKFFSMKVDYSTIEELMKEPEIHEKVKETPVIPIMYMSPQGLQGNFNGYIDPSNYSKPETENKQATDNEIIAHEDGSMTIPDNWGDDDLEFQTYKEGEPESVKNIEEISTESIQTKEVLIEESIQEDSSIAGFNEKEDREEALKVLKFAEKGSAL